MVGRAAIVVDNEVGVGDRLIAGNEGAGAVFTQRFRGKDKGSARHQALIKGLDEFAEIGVAADDHELRAHGAVRRLRGWIPVRP